MNRLVKTLMDRDGVTEEEVLETIAECRDAMLEALESGDFMAAEEIFYDYFGLEPDYMFDIIQRGMHQLEEE